MIQKKFYLLFPVAKIDLYLFWHRNGDRYCIGKMQYHSKFESGIMYEFSAPLHVDEARRLRYSYSKKHVSWFGYEQEEHSSKHYNMNESCVERDVWIGNSGKIKDVHKFEEQWVLDHLCDIICHCFKAYSLNDLCIQIETLVDFKLLPQYATNVIKKLSEYLRSQPEDKSVLFAVAIGNLLEQPSMLLKWKALDSKCAGKVIDGINASCISVSDHLPQSCERYMHATCSALYNIKYGSLHQIHVFNALYRFYGDVYLRSLMTDTVCQSIGTDKESLKALLELCKQLYENARKEIAPAKDTLERIMRHVSFAAASFVYSEMYKSEKECSVSEQNIQVVLYGSFEMRLEKRIRNIKQKQGTAALSELETTIACFGKYERILEKSREKIEEVILNFIQSLPTDLCQMNVEKLTDLMTDNDLFGSLDKKQALLKAVLSSTNLELLKHFMKLFELPHMKEALESLTCHEFSQYFERYLHAISWKMRNGRESEFEIKLIALCEVWSESFIGNIAEMHNALEAVTVTIFQKETIRSLLSSISVIDRLNSGQMADIFLQQVRQQLNQKTETPDGLMRMLETKYGVLDINSILIADVVILIIGICGGLPTNKSVFDRFEYILNNYELWVAVLSCRGKYANYISRTAQYVEAEECMRNVIHHIYENTVQYDFVLKMNTVTSERTRAAVGLLKLIDKEVEQMLKASLVLLNEMIQDLECAHNVLHRVQDNEPVLSPLFADVVGRIRNSIDYLKTGKVTVSQCQADNIWADIRDIPVAYIDLSNYVTSNIFWNTSRSIVYDEFERLRTMRFDEDALCSIQNLFQPLNDVVCACSTECQLYMYVLLEKGGDIFRQAWNEFCLSEAFTFKQYTDMFGNHPDISKEIELAKNCLSINIDASVVATLERICKIDSIADTVEAIENVVMIFEINSSADETYNTAIEAFHRLLEGTAVRSTFKVVQRALETVFELVGIFSENTVSVITALKNASTLVEFLIDIADDDIKNLIDAVEDISEQQVQESTVSALIEVKQYLYPLLNFESCRQCVDFFRLLEKQTASLRQKAKDLPLKIADCAQHVHNLRSLYNGLANRSEQTKEIIGSILQRGIYIFRLSDGFDAVEFEAVYETSPGKDVRKQPVLIDLRSRALLLMNTLRNESDESRANGANLNRFVQDIDVCLDVAAILFELYVAGHIEYMEIQKEIERRELTTKRNKLRTILNKWQGHLENERNEHYLMNFLYGTQIHEFFSFVENKFNDVEAIRVILMFIHSEMDPWTAKQKYEVEKQLKTSNHEFDIELILHCLGKALHLAYDGLSAHRRIINCKKGKLLTELVKPGKLTVAQLDEGSFLSVQTILSLYVNTTQCLPEPSQVLFCTRKTSWIELELLIERCLGAQTFYEVRRLYCIANVELLPGELQFRLIEKLHHLDSGRQFLLAIICRGSRTHAFVDEFDDCVKAVKPITDHAAQEIFKTHCSAVQTLTSDVAGQGKSALIKIKAHEQKKSVKQLHISGTMRKYTLVDRLCDLKVTRDHVLHIDVGSVDELSELDTFLFELVVLKYISAGRRAVKLESEHVFIEIANTLNDTLRKCLHTAVLFQRIHLNWQGLGHFLISKEINSPVQTVCHFLKLLNDGSLDTTDLSFDPTLLKPIPRQQCKHLLDKYIFGKRQMAFPTMHIIINVLADQLKKMSHSSFFKVRRLREMIGSRSTLTVKSKLVCAMIQAAVDFASCSVSNCRETQGITVGLEPDEKSRAQTVINMAGCGSDGLIRWEDSNHLMFVFHNQNIHTLSALYRNLTLVHPDIRSLFESQMKREMVDFSKLGQRSLQDLLQKVARIHPLPLDQKRLEELSRDYALTADNLLKMVLIMLRIKANIPVLIMGETGCGKTSLIRYLASVCEVQFEVMNIHAGIPEENIIKCILENNKMALEYTNRERWLFLDEVNTSDSIGLMSDAICHHKCIGNHLAPNLIVMGACNPYKLRTSKDIHTAGLEGKIKTDELSKLVYRVLPLPEIMVEYVWDFGSLSEKDEEMYIKRMTHGIFNDNEMHSLFTALLSVSQTFVRQHEESLHSVSLRDVQRCKRLAKWFLEILPLKKSISCGNHSNANAFKAMILSLAHCYQSRFSDKAFRKEYRLVIGKVFLCHGFIFNDDQEAYIHSVIKGEQADFLRRMKLPPGIACNPALQENVFVILVCIYNKIPIFVVGKPGCSKSLALQLIKSNLRGKDSDDDFFKKLPQLYCVSFQGSESSTSDGIIKVFKKAENYQKSNNSEDVLPVVILDEIGLAEISRFNPLKVLHSLLEPEGQSQPNIAVVGISNWALDASKMNRAIHLSRPDMDEDELFDTAVAISDSFLTMDKSSVGIFETKEDIFIPKSESIKDELKGMAAAYSSYFQRLRFNNFHGLRDYYSLVKYVSRMYAESKHERTKGDVAEIIMRGIDRNFGGLPEEINTLYEVFKVHIPTLIVQQRPVLDIVAENISDPIARHLMLITTGESVLGVLQGQLDKLESKHKEVIFGSQFDEDLTDDYRYRILSKIILCMEQGLILILKDLDSIYGSLYDMLNQNYTTIGKKKNCRIALGPYSNPICHVADNFRCIVLIDVSELDMTDPPFLNRFEKQYFRFSDIINADHRSLISKLDDWVGDITKSTKEATNVYDIFPIGNEDLIGSLVLKIESCSNEIGRSLSDIETFEECKKRLFMIVKPEVVFRLNLSGLAKYDADYLIGRYISLPIHHGLEEFVTYQLENMDEKYLASGILSVIFTNSNVHTKLTFTDPKLHLHVEKLGTIKSEKQLTNKVQMFFEDSGKNHLMIQCNAKDEEQHILLTKLIVERCRRIYHLAKSNTECKHVYLVIHIDRCLSRPKSLSQLHFLSDWNLAMLDSLEKPRFQLPDLYRLSLYEAVCARRPLADDIRDDVLWAFSRIRYGVLGRSVESISKVIDRIEKSDEFLEMLEEDILYSIRSRDIDISTTHWTYDVASNTALLNTSSGFVDALERYIKDRIKIPLAKIIYGVENIGILDSYFSEEKVNGSVVSEKRDVWLRCLRKQGTVSLNNILDPSGPECYTCGMKDYQLIMPGSKIVFDVIESTRKEFTKMLNEYRLSCLTDEDEEIPTEIYEEVLKQHVSLIQDKIPDLHEYSYTTWKTDYFADFCSITTVDMLSTTHKLGQQSFLNHILKRLSHECEVDSFMYVLRLHSNVWIHYNSVCAELRLIEHCLDNKVCTESELLGVLSVDARKYVTSDVDAIQEEMIESNCDAATVFAEENNTFSRNPKAEPRQYFESNGDIPDPLNSQKQICDLSGESGCLEEEDTQTVGDILVSYVCEKLLPTQACLELHRDVSNWRRVAVSTLSLATEVSRSPPVLFSVKFCTELAEMYAFPKIQLEHIGNAMISKNALDSDIVYETVMEAFESVSPGNRTACFQTLASYFVRCISVDPNTKIVKKMFDLVEKQSIPTQNLCLFKVALEMLLTSIDEIVYETLLFGSCDFSTDEVRFDQEVLPKTENEMIRDLDHLFVVLLSDNTAVSPSLLMLVDSLQIVFNEMYFSNDDLNEKRIYKCQNAIVSEKPGIRYVASIAFCKCFIVYAAERIEKGVDFSKTMQVLEIVFTDLIKHKSHCMVIYWFKLLCKNWTRGKLQLFVETHKNDYKFLEPFQFEYFVKQLQTSALCLHVSESLHVELCFSSNDDFKVVRARIKDLVIKAKTNVECMLLLLTFGVREFYLVKTIKELHDVERTLASVLLNEVIDADFSDKIISFVERISGNADFDIKEYDLEISTSAQKQVCVFSVIVSLIGLTISHDYFAEQRSFLGTALLDPALTSVSIIAMMNRQTVPMSTVDDTGSCKPACWIQHSVSGSTTLPPDHSALFCYRNPVTDHVINFLIKSCFLSSLALTWSDLDSIRYHPKISTGNVSDDLMEEVYWHWDAIKRYVNVGHNEIVLLFHALLLKVETLLYSTLQSDSTDSEVVVFEKSLDLYVCDVFGDKTSSMLDMHKKYNALHQLPKEQQQFKDLLDEVEDTSLIQSGTLLHNLPHLYRSISPPTKSNMIFELSLRKGDFPFLETVLLHEGVLSLPIHIMNIVLLHSASVANASYMLRKDEFFRMKAIDFLVFKQDSMKTKGLKRRFEEFRHSWEILKEAMKGNEICKEMDRIHNETKMCDCLVTNEHSVIYRVLVILINIQNNFLESVKRIAPDCKRLHTIVKDGIGDLPSVPLLEIKRNDLLDISIDWTEILKQESQNDTSYGHGMKLHYDFCQIEEYLAKDVCGKKIVACETNLDLPKIIFLDELHMNYASLLKEIMSNVNQEELPADIRSGIEHRKEDDPSMASELLVHIGVVMTVVKRVKANPEQPLVEFVDSWKSSMCRQFPKALLPNPESGVKLCHIVALSELLEEICAETTRDGLSNEYREKLDMCLNECLTSVLHDEDLSSLLLKALKRFSYRCLTSGFADPEKTLRQYLSDESFWPMGSMKDCDLHSKNKDYSLSEILPDGLMVRHTFDCIEVIEREIQNRQKGNLKMERFASNFRNKTVASSSQKLSARKMKAVRNVRRF